jgi:hypothetical protein
VCNDGTRAGYFYRQASAQATQFDWLVYLQGGDWCYSQETCDAVRAPPPWGGPCCAQTQAKPQTRAAAVGENWVCRCAALRRRAAPAPLGAAVGRACRAPRRVRRGARQRRGGAPGPPRRLLWRGRDAAYCRKAPDAPDAHALRARARTCAEPRRRCRNRTAQRANNTVIYMSSTAWPWEITLGGAWRGRCSTRAHARVCVTTLVRGGRTTAGASHPRAAAAPAARARAARRASGA